MGSRQPTPLKLELSFKNSVTASAAVSYHDDSSHQGTKDLSHPIPSSFIFPNAPTIISLSQGSRKSHFCHLLWWSPQTTSRINEEDPQHLAHSRTTSRINKEDPQDSAYSCTTTMLYHMKEYKQNQQREITHGVKSKSRRNQAQASTVLSQWSHTS